MMMVLQTSVGTNYIKQIEIDLDKKILVVRLKSSSLVKALGEELTAVREVLERYLKERRQSAV